MKKTVITEPVLAALSGARTEGPNLYLAVQLDRGMYAQVKKILEAAGGIWNKKAQAHVFDGDAAETMEPILLTGEIVKPSDMGQFDTPPDVAKTVMGMAAIEPGMTVLEPSAGIGNLANAALDAGAGNLRVIEIDPKRFARLRHIFLQKPVKFTNMDFLAVDPEGRDYFDRVVMNPPFAPAQADIDHVIHAAKFLKPGGRLVAVMAAGVLFRQNRKTTDFLEFLNTMERGQCNRLPDGAFKSAGTNVKTVIVAFTKPGA